jgi:D-lactate dehydrogenase
MMKLAFYDAKPYDLEFFTEASRKAGVETEFHSFRLSTETASSADGFDAVCVFVNDRIDRPCLEALARSGVRLLTLRCAGFNHVDLAAAAELSIRVCRVPAYSPYAVAEHTIALLLTLNRRIHLAYTRVRDHNFSLDGLVGFDLHGKTAGIIGTGKIGRITAEILCGFGMEVLASDPEPDSDWAASNRVEYVTLQVLLSRSDVVSLHAPLTSETRYLISRETIRFMKDGAYLINTSRGKLIETSALIEALKQKKLGGVALDVYEIEEGVFFEDLSREILQDDELARLISFPNVLVTSHQGFLTREALSEIARVTTENLSRFGRGEDLLPGTEVNFAY